MRDSSPGNERTDSFWRGAASGFLMGNMIALPAVVVVVVGPLWTWRLFLVAWVSGWTLWFLGAAIDVSYQRRVWRIKDEGRWRPHFKFGRTAWLWHLPGSRWLHLGTRRQSFSSSQGGRS